MPDTEPPNRIVLLAYIGRRNYGSTAEPRIVHAYQEVIDGDPHERTERGYAKPLNKAWGIGQVWRCQQTKDSLVINGAGAPEFAGRLDTGKLVVEWGSLDRAIAGQIEMIRRAKRQPDEWREALAPIRKAYLMARTRQARTALLAAVIEEVVGSAA